MFAESDQLHMIIFKLCKNYKYKLCPLLHNDNINK